jgi:hypothetical protein
MDPKKDFKFPSQEIDLPSKGLVYPKESPLSSGKVEMKYMTAKEEDILTNTSYAEKGILLDKLMQSLIVSDVKYNDMISGDKNAIILASRILGYGKDYKFKYTDPKTGDESILVADLAKMEYKELDEPFYKNTNEFDFELPLAKVKVTFKLLTGADTKKLNDEIKGMKKINPEGSFQITTRLKHTIVAINGDRDTATVRGFIDDGYLLAKDAMALRTYMNKITPDVNLVTDCIKENGDVVEGVEVPIDLDFFFPTE